MADKKPLVSYTGSIQELGLGDFLDLFGLKLRNTANTFVNIFANATTAARTWTFPDKNGTVAMTSDITGTNSGTNTGDETTTRIGTLINGATAKATPVDADMLALMDSAASNIVKKLSWLNVKATLKTYFDTLYFNKNSAWTAWTPTIASLTLGNGTLTAFYIVVGKTVHVLVSVTFGNTTSISASPTFTYPAGLAAIRGGSAIVFGVGNMYDNSAAQNFTLTASGNAALTALNTRYSTGITATVPFTWAVNDTIAFAATYEIA